MAILRFSGTFKLPGKKMLNFANRPGDSAIPGVKRFIELRDCPDDYVGQAGKYPQVNTDEDALIFSAGSGGATDHGALTGLADDDHAQYPLLVGRSGGQDLYGGVDETSTEQLRLFANKTMTSGNAAEIDVNSLNDPMLPGGVYLKGFSCASGENGGAIQLYAGQGDHGGNIYMESGIGIATDGGDFTIRAGSGTVVGSNVSGGDLNLNAGSKEGTGTNGDIIINDGISTYCGYVILKNLPSSNPGGSGRVWNNSGVLNIT
jgi:hypothetical protein